MENKLATSKDKEKDSVASYANVAPSMQFSREGATDAVTTTQQRGTYGQTQSDEYGVYRNNFLGGTQSTEFDIPFRSTSVNLNTGEISSENGNSFYLGLKEKIDEQEKTGGRNYWTDVERAAVNGLNIIEGIPTNWNAAISDTFTNEDSSWIKQANANQTAVGSQIQSASVQMAQEQYLEGHKGISKWTLMAVQETSRQVLEKLFIGLPIAKVTGGLSGAKTLAEVYSMAGKFSLPAMAVELLPSNYMNSRLSGATKEVSWISSGTRTGVELLTEMMGGFGAGYTGKGLLDSGWNLVGAKLKKILGSEVIADLTKAFLSEGVEEVTSNLLNVILDNTLGKCLADGGWQNEFDSFGDFMADSIEAFMVAGLSAGMAGLVTGAPERVRSLHSYSSLGITGETLKQSIREDAEVELKVRKALKDLTPEQRAAYTQIVKGLGNESGRSLAEAYNTVTQMNAEALSEYSKKKSKVDDIETKISNIKNKGTENSEKDLSKDAEASNTNDDAKTTQDIKEAEEELKQAEAEMEEAKAKAEAIYSYFREASTEAIDAASKQLYRSVYTSDLAKANTIFLRATRELEEAVATRDILLTQKDKPEVAKQLDEIAKKKGYASCLEYIQKKVNELSKVVDSASERIKQLNPSSEVTEADIDRYIKAGGFKRRKGESIKGISEYLEERGYKITDSKEKNGIIEYRIGRNDGNADENDIERYIKAKGFRRKKGESVKEIREMLKERGYKLSGWREKNGVISYKISPIDAKAANAESPVENLSSSDKSFFSKVVEFYQKHGYKGDKGVRAAKALLERHIPKYIKDGRFTLPTATNDFTKGLYGIICNQLKEAGYKVTGNREYNKNLTEYRVEKIGDVVNESENTDTKRTPDLGNSEQSERTSGTSEKVKVTAKRGTGENKQDHYLRRMSESTDIDTGISYAELISNGDLSSKDFLVRKDGLITRVNFTEDGDTTLSVEPTSEIVFDLSLNVALGKTSLIDIESLDYFNGKKGNEDVQEVTDLLLSMEKLLENWGYAINPDTFEVIKSKVATSTLPEKLQKVEAKAEKAKAKSKSEAYKEDPKYKRAVEISKSYTNNMGYAKFNCTKEEFAGLIADGYLVDTDTVYISNGENINLNSPLIQFIQDTCEKNGITLVSINLSSSWKNGETGKSTVHNFQALTVDCSNGSVIICDSSKTNTIELCKDITHEYGHANIDIHKLRNNLEGASEEVASALCEVFNVRQSGSSALLIKERIMPILADFLSKNGYATEDNKLEVALAELTCDLATGRTSYLDLILDKIKSEKALSKLLPDVEEATIKDCFNLIQFMSLKSRLGTMNTFSAENFSFIKPNSRIGELSNNIKEIVNKAHEEESKALIENVLLTKDESVLTNDEREMKEACDFLATVRVWEHSGKTFIVTENGIEMFVNNKTVIGVDNLLAAAKEATLEYKKYKKEQEKKTSKKASKAIPVENTEPVAEPTEPVEEPTKSAENTAPEGSSEWYRNEAIKCVDEYNALTDKNDKIAYAIEYIIQFTDYEVEYLCDDNTFKFIKELGTKFFTDYVKQFNRKSFTADELYDYVMEDFYANASSYGVDPDNIMSNQLESIQECISATCNVIKQGGQKKALLRKVADRNAIRVQQNNMENAVESGTESLYISTIEEVMSGTALINPKTGKYHIHGGVTIDPAKASMASKMIWYNKDKGRYYIRRRTGSEMQIDNKDLGAIKFFESKTTAFMYLMQLKSIYSRPFLHSMMSGNSYDTHEFEGDKEGKTRGNKAPFIVRNDEFIFYDGENYLRNPLSDIKTYAFDGSYYKETTDPNAIADNYIIQTSSAINDDLVYWAVQTWKEEPNSIDKRYRKEDGSLDTDKLQDYIDEGMVICKFMSPTELSNFVKRYADNGIHVGNQVYYPAYISDSDLKANKIRLIRDTQFDDLKAKYGNASVSPFDGSSIFNPAKILANSAKDNSPSYRQDIVDARNFVVLNDVERDNLIEHGFMITDPLTGNPDSIDTYLKVWNEMSDKNKAIVKAKLKALRKANNQKYEEDSEGVPIFKVGDTIIAEKYTLNMTDGAALCEIQGKNKGKLGKVQFRGETAHCLKGIMHEMPVMSMLVESGIYYLKDVFGHEIPIVELKDGVPQRYTEGTLKDEFKLLKTGILFESTTKMLKNERIDENGKKAKVFGAWNPEELTADQKAQGLVSFTETLDDVYTQDTSKKGNLIYFKPEHNYGIRFMERGETFAFNDAEQEATLGDSAESLVQVMRSWLVDTKDIKNKKDLPIYTLIERSIEKLETALNGENPEMAKQLLGADGKSVRINELMAAIDGDDYLKTAYADKEIRYKAENLMTNLMGYKVPMVANVVNATIFPDLIAVVQGVNAMNAKVKGNKSSSTGDVNKEAIGTLKAGEIYNSKLYTAGRQAGYEIKDVAVLRSPTQQLADQNVMTAVNIKDGKFGNYFYTTKKTEYLSNKYAIMLDADVMYHNVNDLLMLRLDADVDGDHARIIQNAIFTQGLKYFLSLSAEEKMQKYGRYDIVEFKHGSAQSVKCTVDQIASAILNGTHGMSIGITDKFLSGIYELPKFSSAEERYRVAAFFAVAYKLSTDVFKTGYYPKSYADFIQSFIEYMGFKRRINPPFTELQPSDFSDETTMPDQHVIWDIPTPDVKANQGKRHAEKYQRAKDRERVFARANQWMKMDDKQKMYHLDLVFGLYTSDGKTLKLGSLLSKPETIDSYTINEYEKATGTKAKLKDIPKEFKVKRGKEFVSKWIKEHPTTDAQGNATQQTLEKGSALGLKTAPVPNKVTNFRTIASEILSTGRSLNADPKKSDKDAARNYVHSRPESFFYTQDKYGNDTFMRDKFLLYQGKSEGYVGYTSYTINQNDNKFYASASNKGKEIPVEAAKAFGAKMAGFESYDEFESYYAHKFGEAKRDADDKPLDTPIYDCFERTCLQLGKAIVRAEDATASAEVNYNEVIDELLKPFGNYNLSSADVENAITAFSFILASKASNSTLEKQLKHYDEKTGLGGYVFDFSDKLPIETRTFPNFSDIGTVLRDRISSNTLNPEETVTDIFREALINAEGEKNPEDYSKVNTTVISEKNKPLIGKSNKEDGEQLQKKAMAKFDSTGDTMTMEPRPLAEGIDLSKRNPNRIFDDVEEEMYSNGSIYEGVELRQLDLTGTRFAKKIEDIVKENGGSMEGSDLPWDDNYNPVKAAATAKVENEAKVEKKPNPKVEKKVNSDSSKSTLEERAKIEIHDRRKNKDFNYAIFENDFSRSSNTEKFNFKDVNGNNREVDVTSTNKFFEASTEKLGTHSKTEYVKKNKDGTTETRTYLNDNFDIVGKGKILVPKKMNTSKNFDEAGTSDDYRNNPLRYAWTHGDVMNRDEFESVLNDCMHWVNSLPENYYDGETIKRLNSAISHLKEVKKLSKNSTSNAQEIEIETNAAIVEARKASDRLEYTIKHKLEAMKVHEIVYNELKGIEKLNSNYYDAAKKLGVKTVATEKIDKAILKKGFALQLEGCNMQACFKALSGFKGSGIGYILSSVLNKCSLNKSKYLAMCNNYFDKDVLANFNKASEEVKNATTLYLYQMMAEQQNATVFSEGNPTPYDHGVAINDDGELLKVNGKVLVGEELYEYMKSCEKKADKKFIEQWFKFAEAITPLMQQSYYNANGIQIDGEKAWRTLYFPVFKASKGRIQGSSKTSLECYSRFFNENSINDDRAFLLKPANFIVQAYVDQISNYMAYSEYDQMMSYIFDSNLYPSDKNTKDIAASLNDLYGEEGVFNIFKKYARQIKQVDTSDKSAAGEWLNNLMLNLQTATIPLNPRVWCTQIASLEIATAFGLSRKSLWKNLSKNIKRCSLAQENIDKIIAEMPESVRYIFETRWANQQIDPNYLQSYQGNDTLAGKITTGIGEATDKAWNKLVGHDLKVNLMVNVMDMCTVMAKEQTLREKWKAEGKDINSYKYSNAVYEMINEGDPCSDRHCRSDIQRSEDPFRKGTLGMFQTQPEQNRSLALTRYYEMVMSGSAESKKRFAKAEEGIWASRLAFACITTTFSLLLGKADFKDDDGEFSPIKFFYTIGTTAINQTSNIYLKPVTSALLSLADENIYASEFGVTPLGGLNKAITYFTKFCSKPTVYNFKNAAVKVSQVCGVPLGTAYDIVNAVVSPIVGEDICKAIDNEMNASKQAKVDGEAKTFVKNNKSAIDADGNGHVKAAEIEAYANANPDYQDILREYWSEKFKSECPF